MTNLRMDALFTARSDGIVPIPGFRRILGVQAARNRVDKRVNSPVNADSSRKQGPFGVTSLSVSSTRLGSVSCGRSCRIFEYRELAVIALCKT